MTQTTKIVLVTGGSRGLGKNMVMSLAEKGLDILLTYNTRKEEADAVVTQIRDMGRQAACLQLDVSNPAGLDRFTGEVKETLQTTFGTDRFHYLVNNAGIGVRAAFAETTEEQFDTLMNIHLKSPFFLTQKLLPLLADGGGILNVSSGLARFALPGSAAYATMKGAIETLTRYQAKELGARGIRANVIAPGAIETDFGGGAVRDNAQLNSLVASQTALGRTGRPDDIGSVVAFLCSDEAKWVNAQRLEVSGGMFL